MTVTSRLVLEIILPLIIMEKMVVVEVVEDMIDQYRQKDKERKTEENVDGRPVGAPRARVRWRGSSA